MKKKPHSEAQTGQGGGVLSLAWTSFVPGQPDPRDAGSQIWLNSRYQVHVRRHTAKNGGPDLVHLSFKRRDGRANIPYRDKMRIKDALVGAECEGVELYPAHSREVDTANQYHLWVIDDAGFGFPFGFASRLVSEWSIGGATQEPWPVGERPEDCLTREALEQLLSEGGSAHE